MPGRIFISYSKAEPKPTQELAAFLTAQGYTVWWDTNLTSGEVFREVIDRELAAADAVIVRIVLKSMGKEARNVRVVSTLLNLGDRVLKSITVIELRRVRIRPLSGNA